MPKDSAKAQIKRSLQAAQYVRTYTEYNFFGPKAGLAIFRFEEGKIVEHWDNLQDIAPKNTSGRTQFDGQIKIKDVHKTEQNKTIIANFVGNILIQLICLKFQPSLVPRIMIICNITRELQMDLMA
ncbi:hypothetical protein CXF72_18180 [Psychromonas sp. MB-3u-54]|nr:hypothetical protein CXF72_18180 [Psychromonas sp. MB-3u-54]